MALHALVHAPTTFQEVAVLVLRGVRGASMSQIVVVADALFLLVDSTQTFERLRQLAFACFVGLWILLLLLLLHSLLLGGI